MLMRVYSLCLENWCVQHGLERSHLNGKEGCNFLTLHMYWTSGQICGGARIFEGIRIGFKITSSLSAAASMQIRIS